MSCTAYISLLVLVCVCGQNPIDSHLHGYPLAYASARRKRIKEGSPCVGLFLSYSSRWPLSTFRRLTLNKS